MARSKGSRSSVARSLSKPWKKHPPVKKRLVNEGDEPGPSASAKEFKSASSENILVNVTHCYRIIQFLIVFNAEIVKKQRLSTKVLAVFSVSRLC